MHDTVESYLPTFQTYRRDISVNEVKKFFRATQRRENVFAPSMRVRGQAPLENFTYHISHYISPDIPRPETSDPPSVPVVYAINCIICIYSGECQLLQR